MFLAVSTQTSVGWVLVFIALLVAIVFAFANVRQGKAEVGSEVELAPNRRPYLSDAELEGPKLDRTLSMGLLGLAIIGLGLPLYWLQEPARQANEVGNIQRKFIDRGAEMFAPTADGGFNCAFCHGADGGGGAARRRSRRHDSPVFTLSGAQPQHPRNQRHCQGHGEQHLMMFFHAAFS